METYEKKYKELEGKIKKAYLYAQTDSTKAVLEEILPELAESEDERIRKELIRYFKEMNFVTQEGAEKVTRWIAWLEKQEEKPQGKTALEAVEEEKVDNANKAKPKFHEGEWIVWQDKCCKVNYNGCGYELVDQNGLSTTLEYGTADENAHLWDTTKDAEDGDVLAVNNEVFVYAHRKQLYSIAIAHCFVDSAGVFYLDGEFGFTEKGNSVHPATKKQRDLLFQKMKEAGYEWDAEKKEPKKIDQKPAWSEEDDYNLQCMIAKVTSDIQKGNIGRNQELIDWLKSIKDRVHSQSHWKPSDGQIKVCKEVYADILSAKGFDLGTINSELNRLEEQLKKLKE